MTTESQIAGTTANADPGSASAQTSAPDTLLTATPTAGGAPASAAQPAQAAQPAEGTPPDQGAKPAEGEAKPAVPEDYADFNAPEGMTFNTEALAEFKALAKEKGLSQDEAQKFADLGAKAVQKAQAAQFEQIEQVQAQWAEASRTDKEFGGDKIEENVAVAKKALDTFGSPELAAMLKESRLGNHPEIIRAFYRVGKAISEDRLVVGSTKPASPGRFYDKSNHTA